MSEPDRGPATLEGFFRPRAVAVVGASERNETVGRTLFWNLLTSPFGGVVYPVNPTRKHVLGVRAYESVLAIGEPVDLAVIATAAPRVPAVLDECARAGIRNAIIMSAFRETGREGTAQEAQALSVARSSGIRVIGPYSLGVMVPKTGLNATVASGRPRAGRVGVVSQSGTMSSAILDWSERANVGFSAFASVGDMLDVGWGELIYYLGDDPDTRCILLYMETVGDPKGLLSAAREVANAKPIVLMKGGRAAAAARVATVSTGALAGGDEVLDAALRRSGVLRVDSIEDLFRLAEALDKQPLPKGRRLAIVSNAGGPAVLAIDALGAGSGETAVLSRATVEKLDAFLPEHWSRGNPVAGLGDALVEAYPRTVRELAQDPGVNGILVVLTPKPTVDAKRVAERLAEAAAGLRLPVLASWMGGDSVVPGRDVLRAAGIPCFPFPDSAARAFNYLWKYRDNLASLYETAEPVTAWEFHRNRWVRDTLADIIARARAENRVFLTEFESKKILEAYGIPVLGSARAGSAEEAAKRAKEVGFPVVLEGLVRLPGPAARSRLSVLSDALEFQQEARPTSGALTTEQEVLAAYATIQSEWRARLGSGSFAGVTVKAVPAEGYEFLLGSDVDPQFGPVLCFGAGGFRGAAYDDYAVALPPLNQNLARRLLEETRLYRALKENPGPRDEHLSQLETVLVRFSQLILDQPLLREFRVDPLVLGPSGVHAVAAHAILLDEGAPPRVRPAIRPYPFEYVRSLDLADGTRVTLRPIRPEDEPHMIAFHHRLSDRTVYSRYFSYMHVDQRTRHETLSRECFSDYDRHLIFVAELGPPEEAIVGVGRLIRLRGTRDAEFAVMVEDAFQGRRLGKALLVHIVSLAALEGLERVVGHVLEENEGMLALCRSLGFETRRRAGADAVEAVLTLTGAARAPTPERGTKKAAGHNRVPRESSR